MSKLGPAAIMQRQQNKRQKQQAPKKTDHLLIVFFGLYALLIVLVPILFQLEPLKEVAQKYISPMGGMKAAFLGFAGSSIGSFLAIFGSVLLQKKDKRDTAVSATKRAALIVYYDFKFAFDDLAPTYRKIRNEDLQGERKSEAFLKGIEAMYIYLDDNWISNVASLNDILSQKEIRTIYNIYGGLLEIKRLIDTKTTKSDVVNAVVARNYEWIIGEILRQNDERGMAMIYPLEILQAVSLKGKK